MREPRRPQLDMLAGLLKAPRVQLIGSMGLGKSGAMLLHANALAQYMGRWPGLFLLAPLQVALNWKREIPLWLPGLRVEIVAGELAERKAVLQRGADITILTYDHLPWFEEYVGSTSWRVFGEMCMCDESTRVKMTRVATLTSPLGKVFRKYNGGVQTNALARHAEEFPYWVNATGTPTPNGLTDVWGQYWYLDGGLRLGSSYTAFEQRWFVLPNKRTEFAKPIPAHGAMEEISRLTADITVVARVEDYYPDLAKPNLVDRFIELPEKARKVYKDMKARMAAEVADGQLVTVQTAGAKQTKLLQIACILKGTPTLTRRGWLPIETVTAADEVWDGEAWVRTEGAVLKGVKPVIKAFGVWMTRDHKVLTTEGWKPAGDVEDETITGRPDRLVVQLPASAHAVRVDAPPLCDVAVRLRLRDVLCATVSGVALDGNNPKKRWALRLPVGGVERYASTYRHAAIPYMVEHEAALHKPNRQGLPPVRRGGNHRLRTVAAVIRGLLDRHESRVLRWADAGPGGRDTGVHPEQLPMGDDDSAAEQPQRQCVAGHPKGAHDSSTSCQGLRGETRDLVRPVEQAGHVGGTGAYDTAEARPVYDLVNCGPRSRFTVRGADGTPLIVHNCGFAYFRDEDADPDLQLCQELHTAKFDVIDSILNETGESLVVVYFYKATLQMLKKRFKKRLVTLDAKGKVQDDWNAGKVELLALQYSEGALGLSLQHGGRNICLLTPTYRAEDYAQILERLGPMRQMQSGYDRVVNVFRVLAHNTEDARVFDVPLGKISKEQAMVEFMHGLTKG